MSIVTRRQGIPFKGFFLKIHFFSFQCQIGTMGKSPRPKRRVSRQNSENAEKAIIYIIFFSIDPVRLGGSSPLCEKNELLYYFLMTYEQSKLNLRLLSKLPCSSLHITKTISPNSLRFTAIRTRIFYSRCVSGDHSVRHQNKFNCRKCSTKNKPLLQ
jgi:hypothetical protein